MTQDEAKLQSWMLSGDPFTYADMCQRFHADAHTPGTLTVRSMIRRLDRRGLIDITRVGRKLLWTAVRPGE